MGRLREAAARNPGGWMRGGESRREAAQRWLVALIALAAPVLGGSTERWRQGIVFRADLHERLGEWPAAWRALERVMK